MGKVTASDGPAPAHPGRRAELESLRLRLADALDVAEPKEVAALSREMRAVIREIDSLPNPAEVDGVIDLRTRIARKQAAAGL